ncbi:MAG: RNB domain-containing ribonuclease [Treponemataceae bacterium]
MSDTIFQKGSVVLYKNAPSVIVECGEKYTIAFLTVQGNKKNIATQKVREKDIIFLCNGALTEKDLHALYEKKGELKLLAIEEIWQLYEGTQDERINFTDLADLLSSDFLPENAWNFYTQIIESLYFFDASDQGQRVSFKVRSLAEIEKLRQKNLEKEKESSIRQDFLNRLRSKQLNLPEDLHFMQEIESLALGKTEKSKTLKEVGIHETPENAHALLLETGVWSVYKNPYPSRWGLSMHSSTDLLPSPPVEERVAIKDVAFAIDNEWSADPDDAVSFDGSALWVHIADPASSVLPNSTIDINARNRGATLYLPEGTARMLSESCLSDYALGLSDPSNALSFKIILDDEGAIVECEVLKSIVSVERLTYQQAEDKKNDEKLKPLFEIARRNILRRKKNGGVFIDLPEVHVTVRDGADEKEVSITKIEALEASNMVREMMLLAGEAAAKFAFKHEIPFPYVSQDLPDLPKKIEDGLAGQYRLRRSMRSRSVGVIPSSHSGLGIGMYSQVTSPLRRYADLVAHQQLRAFLDKKPLLSKDEVLERLSIGDMAASAGIKSERKSIFHWTLVYLLKNPLWQGDAVVVEVQQNKTILLIPSLAHETHITSGTAYKLNDVVTVKAGKINLAKLEIDFLVE